MKTIRKQVSLPSTKQVLYQLRHINWAKVVFTSALSGQRVNKILEVVSAAAEEHSRRISTATMNMVCMLSPLHPFPISPWYSICGGTFHLPSLLRVLLT